jgi:hypothetical protein
MLDVWNDAHHYEKLQRKKKKKAAIYNHHSIWSMFVNGPCAVANSRVTKLLPHIVNADDKSTYPTQHNPRHGCC